MSADIEAEIQAKRLTAPRVTPADIEGNITSEFYFTASEGVKGASGHNPSSVRAGTALGLLTFCVLVLRNGFTVTGESACASPETFDAEIGRKIARANAVQKIWPLMGFRVARDGWNGKDMWLTYISPDIAGCATEYVTSTKPLEALPWIGMKTADDKFVPWLASQTDVLSQDWGIV